MDALVPTTARARQVLEIAGDFARESGCTSVATEHVLFALAAERNGIGAHALRSLGVDVDTIRACLQRLPKVSDSGGKCTAESIDQLLLWAQDELAPLQHTYVGTENLLLALTHVSSGRCSAAFAALKLDPNLIREEVYSMLGHFA